MSPRDDEHADEKKHLGTQGVTAVDAAGQAVPTSTAPHAAPSFTPGPWRIDFFETSARWPVIQAVRPDGADPEDNDIAELCGVVAIRKGEKWRPEVSASHVMANAHLIAAAPDLHAALDALRADYELLCGDALTDSNLPDVLRRALKALAKAEGKS